jgi:uncharacterized repeat protein (TIGR03803 family)
MPTGVTLGKNGRLYGTTYAGGTNSSGTVFELSPAGGGTWAKTVLHDFSGPDGAYPDADLVFGTNGTLYGTTQGGGSSNNGGTVFRLVPPAAPGGTWTETVLHSFNGLWNSQHTPYGGVIVGASGALYGTTYANWCFECGPDGGGNVAGGTVFMLTPPSQPGGAWALHTILNMETNSVGAGPLAGVIPYGGALYGTTWGDGGCGTAYELSPPAVKGGAWTATAIHNFGGSGDGCNPEAPLRAGPGGVLYGTTSFGGSGGGCPQAGMGGCGVVFQLMPPATLGGTWTYTVIYSFSGANGDGSRPGDGPLLVGGNGVLYGTTECGGNGTTAAYPCAFDAVTGSGVVFSLTPPTTPGGAWSEKILHSFTGGAPDGAAPVAGLTLGPDGVLYGTTTGGLYFTTPGGGGTKSGTVFSIKP